LFVGSVLLFPFVPLKEKIKGKEESEGSRLLPPLLPGGGGLVERDGGWFWSHRLSIKLRTFPLLVPREAARKNREGTDLGYSDFLD